MLELETLKCSETLKSSSRGKLVISEVEIGEIFREAIESFDRDDLIVPEVEFLEECESIEIFYLRDLIK